MRQTITCPFEVSSGWDWRSRLDAEKDKAVAWVKARVRSLREGRSGKKWFLLAGEGGDMAFGGMEFSERDHAPDAYRFKVVCRLTDDPAEGVDLPKDW